MSRIGKRPIPISKGVEVRIEGDLLIIKGPRGELRREIHPKVQLKIDESHISVLISEKNRKVNALHGLYSALIFNMVIGVTKGFEKELEIVGVGYRAELNGRFAVFNLGYSHPINYELPEGIDARIEKTKILLSGIDNELLGRTAAKIRSFRKPEPYKGKGIKYKNEIIRRKAGKAGALK
jgi:large subunit ribosomal protein L6